MTSLEQELKHVKAYLELEQARFVNKLEVIYEIDQGALLKNIPPLTLQPIVENAIKHGIKNKESDCRIKITIKKRNRSTYVKVEDNGHGMESERASQIGKSPIPSETGTGLALYNVNRRLTMMFGEEAALKIKSEQDTGTEIAFSIPYDGDE
jgi:two-component system sensor histidine kinase LytS